MLRVIVVSAALLAMLGGCAVTDAKMANNKGQTAQCSTFGMGVIGTLVAVSMYQNCVEEHKKQGYHEVPAKTSAAPTSTGQQTTK